MHFANLFASPGLTWNDLSIIRNATKLPVILKGIQHPDDAKKAIDNGADGIIVSNHGGRQLDTSVSTCEALPHVAEAVGSSCEVYVDGGVRRGSDVLKAIALGARVVLVGRPILWGLAISGEHGAVQVLEILRRELDEAMLLCGCSHLSDINAALLSP